MTLSGQAGCGYLPSVAALCERFDLGIHEGPPTYMGRGETGCVSRLVTSSGVWAVKEIELFVPSVEEADANLELQEAMLDAGVNLPRPHRSVDGHALSGRTRVYEWLDMAPIPRDDPQIEAQVAAALARIHLHAPPTDQSPDPWYCETASREDWDALIEEAAGFWWAAHLPPLVADLAEARPPLHSPARICHLDVCPENVLLSDRGLTIIDWENAGPAAPLQDLGSTVWDFCQGDVGRTRAFVDVYRRQGGPVEVPDAALFDTALVVQANLVEFHGRRALDRAGTPETHERADQALQSILSRPLTRRLAVEMVAAL